MFVSYNYIHYNNNTHYITLELCIKALKFYIKLKYFFVKLKGSFLKKDISLILCGHSLLQRPLLQVYDFSTLHSLAPILGYED